MNAEDVRNFFVNGGKLAGNLFINLYEITLEDSMEEAFGDAIKIGIINTITALYNADVKDEVILRETNAVWGIGKDEVISKLVRIKRKCAVEALKQHLRLQGWNDSEIVQYMISTNAARIISDNHDLLELKNSPDKLYKAINDKVK